ncbi:hypothetical protein VTN02DRAFT_6378 [Thermoascus thermophilus]
MVSTRSHRSSRAAQKPTPPPVSASLSAADAAGTMDLKSAIEQGVLTTTSTYREFMTFLDLKHEYHNGFKTLLADHVTEKKHSWERLFASKAERQTCATGFADEFGMRYWGTEENRAKYLLRESLADTDLFTYPERREEIIQVIMILLQKMAKSKKDASQQGPETVRPSSSSSGRLVSCVDEAHVLSPVHKSSKRARESTPRKESKRRSRCPSRRLIKNHGCPSPELGEEQPQPGTNIMASDEEGFDLLEQKYARVTRFLVTASTQGDAAPVSSAFYRYSSVSRFLGFMADECGVAGWDPTGRSHAGVPSPSSALSGLVAYASLTFRWSGHRIRVRPGKEKDWTEALRHIHRAWWVEERKRLDEGRDDDDSWYYGQEDFNIDVLLHLTG